MKRVVSKTIGVMSLVLGVTMMSFTVSSEDIKGWFLAGSSPESYEIGRENDAQRNGTVGFLKSSDRKIPQGKFGTIMQQFTPKDYLGKRVKLTGYIRSSNVEKWAGMWMRVDGDTKKHLALIICKTDL
ncbi:hypothetical protein [uncultured Kriegella sp.]|uniref:hypothetical protein n=1 Tax=uncultured Kriegella sp. TaxID=1798910 RepID=UPI0030DA323E|tara:strand:- start:212406 stop:212789 length:384 start_codon:yes stop_codon:yes gene_type:complete